MKDFELAQPTSVARAVELLGGPPGSARALAGGQDLLALLKDYVWQPERLVNLKTIPGLKSIEIDPAGNLRLGALVTLAELAEHPRLRADWPILAQAAAEAATPQIRNLGTVGGNLCQHPRCWYYRAEALRCLRKGGDACLAAVGDHRHHSIFGQAACIAPHYSALGLTGTALGATVVIVGPAGQRSLDLPALYASLNTDPTRGTALASDEIITHLVIPPLAGRVAVHEEVRFKQSHDWPLATATAVLQRAGRTVLDGRLVLGGVAPTPHLAETALARLKGRELTPELAEQAAAAELAQATPLALNAYKVPLCRNLLRRVLLAAGGLGEQP